MTRKRKVFPTDAAARADMRRCVNCQHPFSLALDGDSCPNCACTKSVPAYPSAYDPDALAPEAMP